MELGTPEDHSVKPENNVAPLTLLVGKYTSMPGLRWISNLFNSVFQNKIYEGFLN